MRAPAASLAPEPQDPHAPPTEAEVDRMLAEFLDAPSMDYRESVRHALEDFVTRRRDGLAGLLLALFVGTGATLPTAENGLQCAPTTLVYLYIIPTDDDLARARNIAAARDSACDEIGGLH